jgi:predicted transcriptional regulator
VAHADYASARKCCGVDREEPRQRRGCFNRHARNRLRTVTRPSRRPFGNARKYFDVLYNNDEPDYRRSGGRGVSVTERSRRPGAFVATSDPIELATEIMVAFVANNAVPRADLPALFEGLHSALKRLADGEVASPVVEPPTPAVSVRRSVTPDYLICLEDGKRFKSLRRHLAMLGMTPEQYRAKWNLPSTYPMVAPNSTAQRSAFAKNIGFGLREKPIAAPPASAAAIEAVTDTIEVIAPEPARVDTIEVATVEPTSVAKRKAKAKAKSKVVAAPTGATVKRKPGGRPRKATA